MMAFIVKRLIISLVVLLLVTVAVFAVMHLLPTDPILIYIAKNDMSAMSSGQIEALRHQFGLDQSVPVQYVNWLGGLVTGNMGKSIFYGEDVSAMLALRLPITIHLGLLTFIISAIFGIFLGVISAVKRGKWIDSVVTVTANLGITAPSFWVAILMIYVFSYKLSILPVYGYTSPFQDFWKSTQQVIMPVFCLALVPMATLARQTRSSMLEVIRQDYIRTAWSKGLSQSIIILRHSLKNAFIPVVTILGVQVRNIFGGAVIIETIFNIPGLGRMMVEALRQQDYQVVQAGVVVVGVVVLFSNMLVDISYGWFDPRIQYS
jgi:peptide/nickel transport system permease protein